MAKANQKERPNQKEIQKPKVAGWLFEQPKATKKEPKQRTTQTQTFETVCLVDLVRLLNENKGLTLQEPTIEQKGSKKQLFKVVFYTLLESFGLSENEIREYLTRWGYLK